MGISPQHTHRGHSSESVAPPGREQAFFTFLANTLHTRTIQPEFSQRACVRPDASQVLVRSSLPGQGLCLRLCFVPTMLDTMSHNSCSLSAEPRCWTLPPALSCTENDTSTLTIVGVDFCRISIFSVSTQSPKLDRKENCTIRKRDEFGW